MSVVNCSLSVCKVKKNFFFWVGEVESCFHSFETSTERIVKVDWRAKPGLVGRPRKMRE